MAVKKRRAHLLHRAELEESLDEADEFRELGSDEYCFSTLLLLNKQGGNTRAVKVASMILVHTLSFGRFSSPRNIGEFSTRRTMIFMMCNNSTHCAGPYELSALKVEVIAVVSGTTEL